MFTTKVHYLVFLPDICRLPNHAESGIQGSHWVISHHLETKGN